MKAPIGWNIKPRNYEPDIIVAKHAYLYSMSLVDGSIEEINDVFIYQDPKTKTHCAKGMTKTVSKDNVRTVLSERDVYYSIGGKKLWLWSSNQLDEDYINNVCFRWMYEYTLERTEKWMVAMEPLRNYWDIFSLKRTITDASIRKQIIHYIMGESDD